MISYRVKPRLVVLRALVAFVSVLGGLWFAHGSSVIPAYAAATKMYFTTRDYYVKRANPDGTSVEQLYYSSLGSPGGVALDTTDDKVYFTDNDAGVAKIQRMNLDGTDLEDVLTGVQAISIALDVSGGKMYFTTRDYYVKRVNLDGTNVEVLYTSAGGAPNGVALDTTNGKVYFTDDGVSVAKIQRMNLDGTGIEDLLTGVRAISIALDVSGGKMYFTTRDYYVKRANLNGTSVESLYYSSLGSPGGIALDTTDDKVYFTDNDAGVAKIQRMNLDGTGLEDLLTGVRAISIALDLPTPTAVHLTGIETRSGASGIALGVALLGGSALYSLLRRRQIATRITAR